MKTKTIQKIFRALWFFVFATLGWAASIALGYSFLKYLEYNDPWSVVRIESLGNEAVYALVAYTIAVAVIVTHAYKRRING